MSAPQSNLQLLSVGLNRDDSWGVVSIRLPDGSYQRVQLPHINPFDRQQAATVLADLQALSQSSQSAAAQLPPLVSSLVDLPAAIRSGHPAPVAYNWWGDSGDLSRPADLPRRGVSDLANGYTNYPAIGTRSSRAFRHLWAGTFVDAPSTTRDPEVAAQEQSELAAELDQQHQAQQQLRNYQLLQEALRKKFDSLLQDVGLLPETQADVLDPGVRPLRDVRQRFAEFLQDIQPVATRTVSLSNYEERVRLRFSLAPWLTDCLFARPDGRHWLQRLHYYLAHHASAVLPAAGWYMVFQTMLPGSLLRYHWVLPHTDATTGAALAILLETEAVAGPLGVHRQQCASQLESIAARAGPVISSRERNLVLLSLELASSLQLWHTARRHIVNLLTLEQPDTARQLAAACARFSGTQQQFDLLLQTFRQRAAWCNLREMPAAVQPPTASTVRPAEPPGARQVVPVDPGDWESLS